MISQQGIDLIKGFENFMAHPYNDDHTPPNATIGYGTVLHSGPVTSTDLSMYINGITEYDAEQKLLAHVRDVVAPLIQKYILKFVELSQDQYDAISSFLYNVGAQAFRDPATGISTGLARAFASGHLEEVPVEMCKWVYSGGRKLNGLISRRAKEAALFMRGTGNTAQNGNTHEVTEAT